MNFAPLPEDKPRSFTLAELAEQIGAALDGPPERRINGVATLREAQIHDVSFFANRLYRKELLQSQAGAIILAAADRTECPTAALLMDNPYLGYARAATLFTSTFLHTPAIHHTAWVDPSAQIDPSAFIGPQVTIEAGVKIGAEVVVNANCVIEQGVKIGAFSRLHSGVTLCRGVKIGQRVIIHPGAVVGSDGFGLANDQGKWIKVPQLGGVEIGDDVEIGANTTIDRGALDNTVIEEGVKLDNLIQIAHNVRIGAHTAIAGCVGIAGSTRVGRHCTIGGGVGIVGHIEIVDHVHITGGSIVLQSISEPGVYSSGVPLQFNRAWHRNYIRFKQLDEFSRRLRHLEEHYLMMQNQVSKT